MKHLLLTLSLVITTLTHAEVAPPSHEEIIAQDFKNQAITALEILNKNPALQSSHDTIRNAMATKVSVDANQFVSGQSEKHLLINHNLQDESTIVLNPTLWNASSEKAKRRYALFAYAILGGISSDELKQILSEVDHEGSPLSVRNAP